MASLVEEMIGGAARELTGGNQVTQSDGSVIDFSGPWPRKKYRDAVMEVAGADWFQLSRDAMEKKGRELGLELEPKLAAADITQKVFEKKVEGQAVNPSFHHSSSGGAGAFSEAESRRPDGGRCV